jgi:glycerol-3-phosphate dehydrogenase
LKSRFPYNGAIRSAIEVHMPSAISTDVLIVGAGVAGLWLNARLRRQGFSTVVVESASLGGGQTVKSQGIIHGGAKYALHGALSGASEAIADMPRRWREALAGKGELNLSGVRLLSEAHYLWSPGTLAGNLTSFFASKAVRGRVDQVKGSETASSPARPCLQRQGLPLGGTGDRRPEPD